MGGKQRRQRRRLYLSAACLILVLAPACAPHQPARQDLNKGADERPCVCEKTGRLRDVDRFVISGDFDGALEACRRLLTRSPEAPGGDEALMAMGLISVHYANPRRDYRKAIGYFLQVGRKFPQSPLVEEANIWVGVLRAFEKARQVDIEIEEKKKALVK